MLVWFCSFVWPQLDFVLFISSWHFSVFLHLFLKYSDVSLFFLSLILKVHCAFPVLYYSFIVKIGLNSKKVFCKDPLHAFPLKAPLPSLFLELLLFECLHYWVHAVTYRFPSPFFFWPLSIGCGILVFQPGIEPRLCTVKALSLNHWLLSWHFESFPWLDF